MSILTEIDKHLSKYFNIMAFVRTILCVLFLAITLCSCMVSLSFTLPFQSDWEKHMEHLVGDDEVSILYLPTCDYCKEHPPIEL